MKRSIDPRRHSRRVVDGDTQAPARAMLRAVGFRDQDFERPQIGVASTWANLTPCNMHIGDLAREACAGVDGGGGKSVLFNTITVSDGISMGTPGMRYSLVSREIIADGVEAVARGHAYDALVTFAGCDKTLPGMMMAMVRLNIPAVFVYGGAALPGRWRGRDVTVLDTYEAVGAVMAGDMKAQDLDELEHVCLPTLGSLGLVFARQLGAGGRGRGQALRLPAGGRGRGETYAHGLEAARHPHAPIVRERHHRGDRPRRLDQCGAAPAGHRA